MFSKAKWGVKVYSTRAWSLDRNRELQLYELSNLEPSCQIGGLEAVLLKLDY